MSRQTIKIQLLNKSLNKQINYYMIYQFITPKYFQQARQLVYRSFATNTVVPKILGVTDQEVHRYRYEYIKISQHNTIIALDHNLDKVVGIIFTSDFLDFANSVCTQKIVYSQGFQFMRENILKVIVQDYIKSHTSIKRGETAYSYSGCVDYQYRNRKILPTILAKMFEHNKNQGFKNVLAYTAQQRAITAFTKNSWMIPFESKLISYPFEHLIYKGQPVKLKSWLIETILQ